MNHIEALLQKSEDLNKVNAELVREVAAALNTDAVTSDLVARFDRYMTESREVSKDLAAAVAAKAR